MTRKKLFMAVQAVRCTVIAALLAGSALSLYLDGTAKRAEGGLFCYMFTRDRVGAKLMPILPLLFCAVGLTIAGVILGIRDENADKPVKDERLLLNAADAMPQTIIPDRQGVVVYNAQAPLTHEKAGSAVQAGPGALSGRFPAYHPLS